MQSQEDYEQTDGAYFKILLLFFPIPAYRKPTAVFSREGIFSMPPSGSAFSPAPKSNTERDKAERHHRATAAEYSDTASSMSNPGDLTHCIAARPRLPRGAR